MIGPNTVIDHCAIGDDVIIGANCTIGFAGYGYEKNEETGAYERFPHIGNVVIGNKVEIGSNTCIDRGALGSTTPSPVRGCARSRAPPCSATSWCRTAAGSRPAASSS